MNHDHPLVSVVIPVFDGERFLSVGLESVIANVVIRRWPPGVSHESQP